jgi:uncharacterized protein (UPF0332 family)
VINDRFALQAWSKAESFFAEASKLQAETVPAAIVHSAYYAMFHAARAVLLRSTGSTPKKHSSVVGQFGYLVRDRSTALKQAGHDLRVCADEVGFSAEALSHDDG